MSTPALPLLTEQRIAAFKTEATSGTAEALTATHAVTNCFDSKIESQGEITRRKGQSAFSPLPGVPGLIWNKFTFKSELYGGGSAAVPYWVAALEACGMSLSTATLTPKTGSSSSITAEVYNDGKAFKTAGAMGNFTLTAEAGKPAVFSWDFSGPYIPPADVALITPTYDTVIPPVFEAAAVTIGGTAYNIAKLEISPNNTVVMRKAGNQGTYGYIGAYISTRRWGVKVTLEETLTATQDWYGMYVAGTTAALSGQFGSATNNTITVAAPKMQLAKQPNMTDMEGAIGNELEFDCIRNAAAGDDEVSILFA